MATALDIITKAMQKAGIIYKQETPDADESADALDELNQMIDGFSNESMLITARTRESFSATGAASYTIGSGGDFDTARPTYIVEAHTTQSDIVYPMGVMTDEVYERTSLKNLQGTPEFFNYTNGYPLGTLYLWPVPDATHTIHITSEKPLTEFAALTTTVDLAPGWKELLIYNLAVRLAAEYGQPVTQEVKYLADQSMRNIKLSVMKNRSLDAFPQSVNRGNIYNGWST